MSDKDNPHFTEIFWFCCFITLCGFAYISAVTFILIPEKNQRTVDTVVGFVLGSVIMSAVGYLLGGNPAGTKKTTLVPENSDTTVQVSTVSTDKKTDIENEITTKT